MKTETKVVLLLFVMAFVTVFLLYAAVSNDRLIPETPVIPTKDDIGKYVYVEGTVLSKRSTFQGEHLIVNIECSDRTVLMIFVPKSSGAAAVNQNIAAGDFAGVKGTVEEYNGTLEIVLKKETDFVKLK